MAAVEFGELVGEEGLFGCGLAEVVEGLGGCVVWVCCGGGGGVLCACEGFALSLVVDGVVEEQCADVRIGGE